MYNKSWAVRIAGIDMQGSSDTVDRNTSSEKCRSLKHSIATSGHLETTNMGLKDELVVASDPNEEEQSESGEVEDVSTNTEVESTEVETTEVETTEETEEPAPDAEEEEEEADLIDPQDTLKEQCQGDAHCQKYKAELDLCTERVEGKESTTETCAQELYDFIHCVDHCVSKKLFAQLK